MLTRLVLLVSLVAGCAPTLSGNWVPANRARLESLLTLRGRRSVSWSDERRPVAVFDWDNTMMRNDIGDATLAYMLRHEAVLVPPDGDWARSNRHLTPAAVSALGAACPLVAGGKVPTAKAECAEEILHIYEDETTTGGVPAWDTPTGPATHQPYAWAAELLAGHTPAEAKTLARAAYVEAAAAPIGSTQTVGKHVLDAWVRIYPEMHGLVSALQREGFEVFIVSASAQPLAEIVAAEVGIAADHVVGVRNGIDGDGKLTAALEPCGTLSGDEVMTYDEGKRCFINKVIFRRPIADQLPRATNPSLRPAFAAGDSDTDLAMVIDAVDLKLTLERNRPKLTCHARHNAGKRWLIQPMFIRPMPPAPPASCAGLVDEDGKPITP